MARIKPQYPPAWEEAESLDRLPNKCPYSEAEIEKYLATNHDYFSPNGAPHGFRVNKLLESRSTEHRRYWLYDVVEGNDTIWFVIVGAGRAFADRNRKMRRWMFCGRNDENLGAEQYLTYVIKDDQDHYERGKLG